MQILNSDVAGCIRRHVWLIDHPVTYLVAILDSQRYRLTPGQALPAGIDIDIDKAITAGSRISGGRKRDVPVHDLAD